MKKKMKKGTVSLLLTVLFLVVLSGCAQRPSPVSSEGASEEPKISSAPSSTVSAAPTEAPASGSQALLEGIVGDFSATAESLSKKLEETFSAVGETYDDYKKNKAFIDEWFAFVYEETEKLFARTREDSIAYFKMIAEDPDHKYAEFCEEALEDYYDIVYEDAMDIYYDKIYEDGMDDLKDKYYDGIIHKAKRDINYGEWSEVSSEAYQIWSEAHSEIYRRWSEEHSYLYGLRSAISSAFCWNNNYDVDAIVEEYEKEQVEEETSEAESSAAESAPEESSVSEPQSESESSSEGGSNAESSYQAILDEYSAIIRETTPALVEEYNAEAEGNTEGIEGLAKLSNEKVSELAEISNEGIREMAKVYYKKGSGGYSEYEEWAGKLMDVYLEEAEKITDAYMDSVM